MQLLVPLLHSNICFPLVGISNTCPPCVLCENWRVWFYPVSKGLRLEMAAGQVWVLGCPERGKRCGEKLMPKVILLLPLYCEYCTVIQSRTQLGYLVRLVPGSTSHSALQTLLSSRGSLRHGNLQDLPVLAVNEDKTLEGWRENAAGENL